MPRTVQETIQIQGQVTQLAARSTASLCQPTTSRSPHLATEARLFNGHWEEPIPRPSEGGIRIGSGRGARGRLREMPVRGSGMGSLGRGGHEAGLEPMRTLGQAGLNMRMGGAEGIRPARANRMRVGGLAHRANRVRNQYGIRS